MEHPSEDEAVATIQNMMNKTVRITCSDGRLFIGELIACDYEQNVILRFGTEYRLGTLNPCGLTVLDDQGEITRERGVGMIMVPGHHLVKFEIQ
jgi:small nuclear ribonucleoprotein (snRNP)-like protein